MMPPEITWNDIDLLTVTSFYGYPRSGTLRWNGARRYFFEVTETREVSLLNVIDLSQHEWAEEDQRDRLFRRYVAEYDYENNVRVRTYVQPREEHHKFYDAVTPLNVPDREPVAIIMRLWAVNVKDCEDGN